MSLFPAYSGEENSKQPTDGEGTDKSWLALSSFPEQFSNSSNLEEKRHSRKNKKNKKHDREHKIRKAEEKFLEKAREKMEEILSADSKYYIDRKGSINNTLIPTLMKTDAPMYKKPKKSFVSDFIAPKRKSQKWRYFLQPEKIFENDATVSDELPAQTKEDIIPIGNTKTHSVIQNSESEISKNVASFNQSLTEDPHNEELWLKYVDYQDEIKKFELRYKKLNVQSISFTEKKLSILEKALLHNPLSEILLNRKLNLLNEINNLDKISEEVYSILRQDFGNLNLWNRYIRITQCTVSRCTVPKVISLYEKAMEKINFMRKHGILMTEVQLIELFMSCALFLRQCGLWEQLCMLSRLNLQLNLSNSNSADFKINVQVPENDVKQLEDEILSCGLPIYSLWLRIEKLRQKVHWYPVADEDCEDPQRIVVPTDVTDLIRPITTQALSLRIVIVVIHLLKVPLIPLRDCIFRMLGFHQIPWYLDNIEILLSAFCSISITQGRFRKHEEAIISCLRDLVSYPQYVNEDFGREQFLEFVRSLFKEVSRNLPLEMETVMLVWWLRFERTLLVADRQPVNHKKRLKSSMKELLKEERHRNNLPLFMEYALLEKELNNSNEACLKILETALLMHPVKKNSFHMSAVKNSLTQLYRVTSEILLLSNQKEKALRMLISLALAMPEKEVKLNDAVIKSALQEYQKVTDETFAKDFTDELECSQLQPQFAVEWAVCQAWFLCLTESVWSACAFLEELLRKIPIQEGDAFINIGTYYRELLTEALITILHKHCETSKTAYNVLNESLQKGMKEFPNNMLFLCTLSDLETKRNFVSPWWKLEKCLKSNDSQIAKVILILLCRRRLMAYEEAHLASLKLLDETEVVPETGGFSNRVRSLLMRLTKDEITRQSPLIWMIYLQYCARFEKDEKYRDVFHLAIENCPWVKALYLEGAQVLLDQVSQVQDIMVEKEIRIHITQDEIDILRDT